MAATGFVFPLAFAGLSAVVPLTFPLSAISITLAPAFLAFFAMGRI